MGPVINEGAMKTILDYIEAGKNEGRLHRGRRAACDAGEGYFIQPTVIRRYSAEVEAGAGRDLRSGAGRDQSRGFRSCTRNRQRHGVRPDGRGLHQLARRRSNARSASSTSAISTSIASAPAPWSARIRSADSTCRAPIRKPAARITCTCSRRRNPSARKSRNNMAPPSRRRRRPRGRCEGETPSRQPAGCQRYVISPVVECVHQTRG